jgi:nitrogen regulatory protein PII-like uncharacterized protein
MNPFDFIEAISKTKKNLIVDEISEKQYSPWMVNKGLSYFIDTVLYANEMNMLSHLDNNLQNSYLINSIQPKKRFSRWHKKKEDDDLDSVMKCYGVSLNKAKMIISILSKEQMKTITEMFKELK